MPPILITCTSAARKNSGGKTSRKVHYTTKEFFMNAMKHVRYLSETIGLRDLLDLRGDSKRLRCGNKP